MIPNEPERTTTIYATPTAAANADDAEGISENTEAGD